MTVAVRSSDDPSLALDSVGDFLGADPVGNNLLLSLLTQRVARPEGGRFWWATDAGEVAGFAMQSPARFRALVSRACPAVVDALVDVIAGDAPGLPGVMGEAGTAAAFAGQWAERRRVPVTPTEGQRLYRLAAVRRPGGVPGSLRPAGEGDRAVLVVWAGAFVAETGGHPSLPAEIVDRHLAAGRLSVWDDGGPVSMAAVSAPVAAVVRVAFVYTPPERRGRGYAAACVAGVSERAVAGGEGCVLYAQLHNATSNGVYRRIGYEPAAEIVIYRFG